MLVLCSSFSGLSILLKPPTFYPVIIGRRLVGLLLSRLLHALGISLVILALKAVPVWKGAFGPACRKWKPLIRGAQRVWMAKGFCRAMTSVLHRFGDENSFEGQVLQAGLNYVLSSDAGKMMRAENHVGLPD